MIGSELNKSNEFNINNVILTNNMKKEYVFGVKLKDNKTIISVTPKKEWVTKNKYINDISPELELTMDYYGFEKNYSNWEFVSESGTKNVDEIISLLNKNPMLEYNDKFNDFSLSYIYCIKEVEGSDDYDLTLYISPMLYWINEKCQSNQETDLYILKYLDSFKLDEVDTNIFVLPNENKHYNKTTFIEELNKSKYLEYSEDFDKYIC